MNMEKNRLGLKVNISLRSRWTVTSLHKEMTVYTYRIDIVRVQTVMLLD